jgi:hypothetical protein
MHQDNEPIDITTSPELRHLAEEVQRTGKPRMLRRNGEALAMIIPLSTQSTHRIAKRELTAQDLDAFRPAAGTWSDVDVEQFLTDVYVARDVPDDHPSVEL